MDDDDFLAGVCCIQDWRQTRRQKSDQQTISNHQSFLFHAKMLVHEARRQLGPLVAS